MQPTGQALSECGGYALISPVEASQLALLESFFALPDPAEASAMFTLIVTSIVGAFLTGRAFGKPANLVR
ncbi:hypothetical protein QFW80_04150 [Luteimonas sp. M1R5S18]|uniref:Uncharacterized protein n=1 Tax=Luteimonas rhizosphaericola TaxID=3042024 RepID=A0ABT6JGW1_9GAMM|nr:hypothetical protein [Luteimonas rhizosphaericola]MDH5829710.1 hypothetical protein [Luteimonas rhizosphaericola]